MQEEQTGGRIQTGSVDGAVNAGAVNAGAVNAGAVNAGAALLRNWYSLARHNAAGYEHMEQMYATWGMILSVSCMFLNAVAGLFSFLPPPPGDGKIIYIVGAIALISSFAQTLRHFMSLDALQHQCKFLAIQYNDLALEIDTRLVQRNLEYTALETYIATVKATLEKLEAARPN